MSAIKGYIHVTAIGELNSTTTRPVGASSYVINIYDERQFEIWELYIQWDPGLEG